MQSGSLKTVLKIPSKWATESSSQFDCIQHPLRRKGNMDTFKKANNR